MNKINSLLPYIEQLTKEDLGIKKRILNVLGLDIYILYIPEITNRELLSKNIIEPLLNYNGPGVTIDSIVSSIIYVDDVHVIFNHQEILQYILKGYSIILSLSEDKYIVANTLKIEKRNVDNPHVEEALRSPRDSFTENLETNLSLIRYRIKDDNLRIYKTLVGRRTKTTVAVVYLKDVANDEYVDTIKETLNKIDVDGVLNSGVLQKLLTDNTQNFFPQIGVAERSDAACSNILIGKICILVEGGNLSLILPQVFLEFFDSSDSYSETFYFSIFIKLVTIVSLFITLALPSLYIAVTSFHSDILPPQYILILASTRTTVPVNSFIETFLMEFISEILKEASLRLPKQIGPTISIVGTIVLGQASVSAGLISPLLLIIISISVMTSFMAPDNSITSSIRVIKFLPIIATGTLGLYGFILSLSFIVMLLTSTKSLDVPYTAPLAPFEPVDLKDYFLSDIRSYKKRPLFTGAKNKKRKD
ncbi:spore germination protein [Clostridium malenominatum]|uniref:Spore germination protein n=1 Tax=Clostridium malenominatum TaxID=1539 RepID=A0ABN1IZB0_9CLOT